MKVSVPEDKEQNDDVIEKYMVMGQDGYADNEHDVFTLAKKQLLKKNHDKIIKVGWKSRVLVQRILALAITASIEDLSWILIITFDWAHSREVQVHCELCAYPCTMTNHQPIINKRPRSDLLFIIDSEI